jgi:hypothetical protein
MKSAFLPSSTLSVTELQLMNQFRTMTSSGPLIYFFDNSGKIVEKVDKIMVWP